MQFSMLNHPFACVRKALQITWCVVRVVVCFVITLHFVIADDLLHPAAERYAKRDAPMVPDFQRHVIPLLGKLGCNSAKCHGSFQGQGGFRLSLFGFDFQSDHAAMLAQASSEDVRRLNLKKPETSLILQKATGLTDHEGGQRFEVGSWEHHLLLRWIEGGAKGLTSVTPDPLSNASTAVESASDESNPITGEGREIGEELFTRSIQPILEDHCFECHGYQAKKGGLSLSNRTRLLEGGESGPSVNLDQFDQSLLLDAIDYSNPSLQMPPSGRLSEDELQAIRKWVELGVPWPDAYVAAPAEPSQKLVELYYEPKEVIFEESGQKNSLKIMARWDHGIVEDVTCLARYQTNDDAIVRIDAAGVATCLGEGDTHVIAFYDNGVAAIPVMRPYQKSGSSQLTGDPNADSPGDHSHGQSEHPIDKYINAKLQKLGLTPSQICTDEEFLRRVSIDLTGTLPTPDDVLSFLSDESPDKRNQVIDQLLAKPSYAAWWTNKLCDFTGCNPKSISSLLEVAREEGYVRASLWYDWIFERVQRNEPYDRIVSGLMLADLSGSGDSMPYFWQRQSLKEAKDTAMSVAHAFLGIQLQCAECHKHPFDQWTQSDFNQFSRFFESVTATKRRSLTDEPLSLKLLRSGTVSMEPGIDPRQPIMEWMQDADNPWFAKAFVNRVWVGYFNRGIVDPPDQFTPANPASHPELLDWLASGFVEQGYDMKWLHRQIVSSNAYQRSWVPNETNQNDRRNFSRVIPRRIPAEVVYDAMKQVVAASKDSESVRENLRRRASGHLSMRMAGTHAMKVFGKPDRSINCDCERVNQPTLLQAIFTQNDPLVRMRLADGGWLIEIEDAEEAGEPLEIENLIEQVWLRSVGRLPDQPEIDRARKHLNDSTTLSGGVRDLLWAMLNSKEFLLNH